MPLVIAPFADEHLDGAAELLAARERARAGREPETPHYVDAVEMARVALADFRRTEHVEGAVALRGGSVLGFMLGARQLPSPTSDLSIFARPRSALVQELGYAAPDDAVETYRTLYAALASGWVREGFLAHYAETFLAAGDALRAWRSLGFGGYMVRGVRDLRAVAMSRREADIEIHRAGEEDADVVAGLAIANLRFHAGPPIFQAYFPETEEDTRRHEREQLADPANARFVAYREGRPVGIATFWPWRGRPGVRRETVHLQHGFTTADARGEGVGAALLDHGLAWAREQGFERCSVNWLAANLLGARFWQRQGFRPVGYRMLRVLDERAAWARPSEAPP